MKFLLVAINASYSHTNLAVRSLSEFAKQNPKYQQNNSEVKFVEFTINQPIGEIFRGIACEKPDYIIFSTYIWNSELLCKIIPEMKKLLPNCKIGAGGPEFGFAAKKYLEKLPVLDFIIRGEGELVIDSLVNGKDKVKLESFCNPKITQDNLPCIFYQDHQEYFPLLPDLHYLPFAYPNLEGEEVDHKIYYYESSRGCPFNCAYCMSSLEKKVRFMPLERTFKDLQRFMDAGVPLVKFVDRTFNLQPERYIKIWEYLLKNHNRKTMFHFEIEAEFLNKEALDFLQKVPEGLMQFEIGIQSSNKKTLKSINRSENTEDLAKNIRGIPSTIHQHLDLIAGLPFEDLESFGKSFDFVMNLEPDALQLGFLKVLSGTLMEQYAKENGWQWMENPAYETFSTPYLSYEDILLLKDVEVLVDAYYNSGVFKTSMKYIARTYGNWNFFVNLAKKARSKDYFDAPRREQYWFQVLKEEFSEDKILYDLLRYDFVKRGKQGNFPDWYQHNYDKNKHRQMLEEAGALSNPRLDFAYSEYEVFNCDPRIEQPEKSFGTKTEILFRYKNRKN